ncbi:MAG: ferredoxin [Methanomicrobiales archaeon]|nr:ferredoxin [Methanomicrobiales archaeon]MDI6877311.1 ferredoxin [Methanomicrobiales archaeon]
MVAVEIDRPGCISCAACWTTCPGVFEENPQDTFSQIREEYRTGSDISRGDVPKDQEDCVREAADLCPTQVIRVE